MSHWTHVNGVVSFSAVGRTQEEMRYISSTILSHLPKVTGSERDMNVRLVQRSGHDTFKSCDEFGVYRKYGVELQSMYDIVLEGNLRDREFQETLREVTKFLCRLSKRLVVENIIVMVKGDFWGKKKYIFSDEKPFADMYELPSWSYGNKNHSVCWWEYLFYKDWGDDDD